jgi:polysaccharide biosynthesis protein PslH
MKKLLFIRYKKSESIPEGGDRATQRNLNVMTHFLGEENIHTYIVHDKELKTADYFKKSLLDYVSGFFYFLKNYYYGITDARLKEIVLLAERYDYLFIDRSVFGVIAKKLKENGYKGKIITFFHNVEVLYFKAKIPKLNLSTGIFLCCWNQLLSKLLITKN